MDPTRPDPDLILNWVQKNGLHPDFSKLGPSGNLVIRGPLTSLYMGCVCGPWPSQLGPDIPLLPATSHFHDLIGQCMSLWKLFPTKHIYISLIFFFIANLKGLLIDDVECIPLMKIDEPVCALLLLSSFRWRTLDEPFRLSYWGTSSWHIIAYV